MPWDHLLIVYQYICRNHGFWIRHQQEQPFRHRTSNLSSCRSMHVEYVRLVQNQIKIKCFIGWKKTFALNTHKANKTNQVSIFGRVTDAASLAHDTQIVCFASKTYIQISRQEHMSTLHWEKVQNVLNRLHPPPPNIDFNPFFEMVHWLNEAKSGVCRCLLVQI